MAEEILISVAENDNYLLDDIIDVIFNYYQINYNTNTLLDELRKINNIDINIDKETYTDYN